MLLMLISSKSSSVRKRRIVERVINSDPNVFIGPSGLKWSAPLQTDLYAAAPCRCQRVSRQWPHCEEEAAVWNDLGSASGEACVLAAYLPRGNTLTLFFISWSVSISLLRATAWLKLNSTGVKRLLEGQLWWRGQFHLRIQWLHLIGWALCMWV